MRGQFVHTKAKLVTKPLQDNAYKRTSYRRNLLNREQPEQKSAQTITLTLIPSSSSAYPSSINQSTSFGVNPTNEAVLSKNEGRNCDNSALKSSGPKALKSHMFSGHLDSNFKLSQQLAVDTSLGRKDLVGDEIKEAEDEPQIIIGTTSAVKESKLFEKKPVPVSHFVMRSAEWEGMMVSYGNYTNKK
ncbi:unnamed protein product [Protopolystoma xenopodis]|uniref:Uncharacterized protein n=1 Tax=Protopolystoma xenopodis TaxID=117903 RepID=A0A3S5BM58_9PLAT|nr:unnamed protein product [Protopolystoma xenopodis]